METPESKEQRIGMIYSLTIDLLTIYGIYGLHELLASEDYHFYYEKLK